MNITLEYNCRNCLGEIRVAIFRERDGFCSVNCQKAWAAKEMVAKENHPAGKNAK